jgi:excisionase family DNA binding protein
VTNEGRRTSALVDAPALLTARQVAEITGISMKQVRRLAAANVIPARRFGDRGHLRFRRVDVENLLADDPGTPP